MNTDLHEPHWNFDPPPAKRGVLRAILRAAIITFSLILATIGIMCILIALPPLISGLLLFLTGMVLGTWAFYKPNNGNSPK